LQKEKQKAISTVENGGLLSRIVGQFVRAISEADFDRMYKVDEIRYVGE
jgi:hypothetical protein